MLRATCGVVPHKSIFKLSELYKHKFRRAFFLKKPFYKLFLSILATMIFAVPCSALSGSEIKEEVSIDFLDSSYVSIFKSKYVDVDGVKCQLGARDAMSFENSDGGRKLLKESIAEPFLSAILGVWQNTQIARNQSLKLKDSTPETKVRESMSIGFLNEKSAVILKTKYINIDNVEYMLGTPFEALFENSEKGRQSIIEEVPECFFSVVMAVWGDTPTVESPKEPVGSEEIEREKIELAEKFSEFQKTQN